MKSQGSINSCNGYPHSNFKVFVPYEKEVNELHSRFANMVVKALILPVENITKFDETTELNNNVANHQ